VVGDRHVLEDDGGVGGPAHGRLPSMVRISGSTVRRARLRSRGRGGSGVKRPGRAATSSPRVSSHGSGGGAIGASGIVSALGSQWALAKADVPARTPHSAVSVSGNRHGEGR